MRFSFVFFTLLIVGIVNWCQSRELKGRVLDLNAHPVGNVQLKLQKSGLYTSTDSAGNFSLITTPVLPTSRKPENSFALQLHNSILTVSSAVKCNYDVRIFDGQGRKCTFKTVLNIPGTFIGSLGSSAPGIFIVQIQPSNSTTTEIFRFINGIKSGNILTRAMPFTQSITAEVSIPAGDTLTCTKPGFFQKKVSIQFDKDSLLTLYMYPESLSIVPSAYPVIDGSTSTQPVGIVLAATIFGTTYGYTDQQDGSKKMFAVSTSKPALADSINNIIVKHNTTHDAYVNVIKGTAGLGLIARVPSTDEVALADSLKVKLNVIPFALDAFVFLGNRKNPVDNITLENIKKIYTGAITDWTSLGGNALKIRPYQREKNSGSQEMMISLVMKETPIISSTDMVVLGMMGPFNVLNTDTAGIGYTVYFYGKNMAPEQYVKFLSVDGVAATSENIRNHTYPLWAEVYLVSRTDLDPTCNSAYIREMILSPRGQEIIKRCGYVPIYN
jgi:ABC-type phosphate transport system substrate-binding protein